MQTRLFGIRTIIDVVRVTVKRLKATVVVLRVNM